MIYDVLNKVSNLEQSHSEHLLQCREFQRDGEQHEHLFKQTKHEKIHAQRDIDKNKDNTDTNKEQVRVINHHGNKQTRKYKKHKTMQGT